VALRCKELETYLRFCLEVTALIYHVGKFLGVGEASLKQALKSTLFFSLRRSRRKVCLSRFSVNAR